MFESLKKKFSRTSEKLEEELIEEAEAEDNLQEEKEMQYKLELNAIIDKLQLTETDWNTLQDAIYKVVDINRREAFRQGVQQVIDFVLAAEDKPSADYEA